MKAVLRLIYTYFTCTPALKLLSSVGALLVVVSTALLGSVPQSGFIAVLAFAGIASLFIGSSMLPLIFGRLARSHMCRTLPGARLKLLVSALFTVLIVAFSVPLELGIGLQIAVGPPHLLATGAEIAKWQRYHDYMIQTFWITYSYSILLAFWLYVALWFITSKRNTVGYLQGVIVIAGVLLAPARQILELDAQLRWDASVCVGTLFTFSALFLLWPQIRSAADRLRLGKFIERWRRQPTRTLGRETDLLLGTANPWVLAVGQLLPVFLAARIGFYSAAVWLFYLTIFSTVAGAIAGQAAERSRSLWLRGDWSTVQLFSRVERSFWRHNNYVLGILLILMVAIGSYSHLPVMLLATGLPLLILGTILSTYLGLMITRGLRWSESLLAIAVMLALMAVAVLAARNSNDLLIVIILEAGLALVALMLRFVARARWERIDWMQCRTDRALTGRSAA
jgi:hypothetical protein